MRSFNPQSQIRNPQWKSWGETPFAALTLLLAAGILTSRFLVEYSFAALAAGGAALAGAALLALSRGRLKTAFAIGLAAVLACGVVLALARRDGYPSQDLRALLSAGAVPLGESVPFEGCIAEQINRHADEATVTIALRALQKKAGWVPVRGGMILRIPEGSTEQGAAAVPDLEIGDRLRGWAACHIPRNFANPGSPDHTGSLLRRGISLIGRTKSPRLLEVIPGDCADPWFRVAGGIRAGLRSCLNKLAQSGHPEQAAVLSSLIVGDYSGLDTETRETFQNSGTYHVLVVSGLHVAWIAAVLLLLFRWTGVPQGVARILVAFLLFFYAGLVGFQASISRALWMYILYLAGQACFRRAAPANVALASAFTLLAARPDWLLDIGFQLSFLSVLAICFTGLPLIESFLKPVFDPPGNAGRGDRLNLQPGRFQRIGRRLRIGCELLAEACRDRWHLRFESWILAAGRGLSKSALAIGSMIVVTVSVQAWLEPLLAYHFNRLSWIAPAANLVAVPLSSLVLAVGIGTAFFSPVSCVAPALLAAAGFLSNLLLVSARIVSSLPGAWQRCPTPPLLLVSAGIAMLFAWSFLGWRRKWIPWCYVCLLLAILSVGAPLLQRLAHRQALEITFLDVGEGDSIVIGLPGGGIWVVDAGGIRQSQGDHESERGFDVGEAVVSRYLWSRWISRLDRIILSHPDQDHAGGMPALLGNFRTAQLDYGREISDPYLGRVLRAAGERGTRLRQVRAGEVLMQDGIGAMVLNPGGAEIRSTNEDSVVLRLAWGRFSAMLTGDLEKAGERDFLSRRNDSRSLLLKAAHHGSRNATTDLFLDAVQPRWAVLSSGRNNPFGHPSKETVARLLRRGIGLLLTQDLGAITFETDGTRYQIRSHVTGLIEQGILR